MANSASGVYIGNGATENTIGGTTVAARDVLSANGWEGVNIVGGGTSDNLVEGDYIGVAFSGTAALGNAESGVGISGGACNNTIGGVVSGSRDVISGNLSNGVYISDAGTSGNTVAGDLIGTNASGTIAVPNVANGVFIGNGATDNIIGGTAVGARDVISGNTGDGVHIVNGATGNVVEGDYIGLNAGGSAALGNGASGVAIYAGASGNTIGGTMAGTSNVISASVQYYGVYISDSGTTGNVVAGDLIGTDSTGTHALANPIGVYIGNGASDNTIGGTTAIARDVISGNTGDGVHIVNGATGNVVEGDYIGLNASGSAALGNGSSGVAIFGGSTSNTIGTGNVISGNTGDGIYISDPGTAFNVVWGDDIGTNPTGTLAVPNYDGVVIQNGATNNSIGGNTAFPFRNVISGNTWDGVHIVGSGTSGNVVRDATSASTASGSAALGNGASGVAIYAGASNNTIGSTSAGFGDVVSGNIGDGFYISGRGDERQRRRGRLDRHQLRPARSRLPNAMTGCTSARGATNNTIGGTTAATRDVISGQHHRWRPASSASGPPATWSRATISGSPPAAPRPWATAPTAWRSMAVRTTTRSAARPPAPATSFRATSAPARQRRVYRRPKHGRQPRRG